MSSGYLTLNVQQLMTTNDVQQVFSPVVGILVVLEETAAINTRLSNGDVLTEKCPIPISHLSQRIYQHYEHTIKYMPVEENNSLKPSAAKTYMSHISNG